MHRCHFKTVKCALLAAAFVTPACGGGGEATSAGTDGATEGETEGETGSGGSTSAAEDSNSSAPTTGDEPTGGVSDSAGMTTSGTAVTDTDATTDPTDVSTTSTDPSTTSGGGVCGDGNVDNGEVCDDGVNDGSYGGCMADCSAPGPGCGDGAVNGPEVCDDGVNDGSYNGCAADCAAPGPFCGDGNFDMNDEGCDDGNMVDDDACSNACAVAACGDGIVQTGAGEVCDDGVNDGGYGGCAVDCLALGPSCGDGNVDVGDETCDDQNTDSTDGCLGNCAVPASCAEILAFDPAAMDGVHGLGVNGVNWQAHCDMTTDGGGWTLAAKLGNTDGWVYQSPRWTDNMTFNGNMPAYDHTQAKLATWNLVPFTQILLGMESPIMMNQNPPPGPVYLTFDQAANSLFELFSPGTYVATTQTRAAWLTTVPMNSLQPNCNREGFNNAPNGNQATRVRIGILGNNQNDCTSPDSAVGFGFGGFQCQNNPFISVGNVDCLTNPVTKRGGFGWLFVR